MPLTLTLTEGVLATESIPLAVSQLTASMLKWHGLTGNDVMTPNVTATVHVQPKGTTFSGGEAVNGAWIEWKTPSFAFSSQDIRQGIFEEAANILHELSNGKQPKNRIFVNATHAVDGGWSLDGKAVTNDQLAAAIS